MRIHLAAGGAAYEWDYRNGVITNTFIASDLAAIDGDLSVGQNVYRSYGILVALPGLTAISKIGIKVSNFNPTVLPWVIEGSADTTNGLDGSWTPLASLANGPVNATYTELAVNAGAPNVGWLRFRAGVGFNCYNVSVFGDPVSPPYEFWNEAGDAKLSGDYPLTFLPAGNSTDCNQELRFRLKNASLAAHSYTLTANPLRYGGDAAITNGFTLAVNGGAKSRSVLVPTLAAGALSPVLSLFANVTKAMNPGDGQHYLAIDVVPS